MARPKTNLKRPRESAIEAVGLTPVARPLGPALRAKLGADLQSLLRFRETLTRFPELTGAGSATPIVTAYREGRLVACAVGRRGRTAKERLARAFLEATSAHDGPLDIELVLAKSARWLSSPDDLELGEEGLALVRPDDVPVLLIPQMARDFGVDGRGFVGMLENKARGFPKGHRLVAFTVERVVGRLDASEAKSRKAAQRSHADPIDFAAAWIARLVSPDGSVAFAIDPVRRILQPRGELHHARVASAIEALASHGGYAREVRRARAWLQDEAMRALEGEAIEHWPTTLPAVAGTLALLVLAGVDFKDELATLARAPSLREAPWHAGQVMLALGAEAPRDLAAICDAALEETPFAPWTALGAHRAGHRALFRRSTRALAESIRKAAPFRGGASVTAVPEAGLTAVAAHALSLAPGHRRTAELALGYVRRLQLLPDRIPASVDPRLALGGFAASPVNDLLRVDLAGHALSALLAGKHHG